MITKQTTLILGAGASKPYGFPTGAELREEIINNTLNPKSSSWRDEFYSRDIDMEKVIKFGSELRLSPLSIDAFIEHREEFMEIGKLCLAMALAAKETSTGLSDPDKWYKYLFDKIYTKNIEDFVNNKLFIVTFNYDRSLDEYLVESLVPIFKVDTRQSLKALNGIMPVHIYGKLGDLPYQGDNVRHINSKLKILDIAINGINLISEREKQPEIIEKIKASIFVSERIYFLGFGYDETNLRRLGIKDTQASIIKGSSFRLGEIAKKNISLKWNIGLPDKSNGDVLHFLENYVDLD